MEKFGLFFNVAFKYGILGYEKRVSANLVNPLLQFYPRHGENIERYTLVGNCFRKDFANILFQVETWRFSHVSFDIGTVKDENTLKLPIVIRVTATFNDSLLGQFIGLFHIFLHGR